MLYSCGYGSVALSCAYLLLLLLNPRPIKPLTTPVAVGSLPHGAAAAAGYAASHRPPGELSQLAVLLYSRACLSTGNLPC